MSLTPGQPNSLAGHKRPLHTIIPGFMQKGDISIGYGIMNGWNQAQAHAQFVADIVDFDMNVMQAISAPRFNKDNTGCTVSVEARYPLETIEALDVMGAPGEADSGILRRDGPGQCRGARRHTECKFRRVRPACRWAGGAGDATAPTAAL